MSSSFSASEIIPVSVSIPIPATTYKTTDMDMSILNSAE
jgi:hypothetical protein